jgi:hypothetical protein
LDDESHKIGPMTFRCEYPRPKSGKSRLNLNGTILEEKSIGLNPKKKRSYKRRAHDLKNQDAS